MDYPMYIVPNQKEESFSVQRVYAAFFELSQWHQEIHFLIFVKKSEWHFERIERTFERK